MMEPGYPRQCYMPMPPYPGRPILPDGLYPVDYDDLCNLSGMSRFSFILPSKEAHIMILPLNWQKSVLTSLWTAST